MVSPRVQDHNEGTSHFWVPDPSALATENEGAVPQQYWLFSFPFFHSEDARCLSGAVCQEKTLEGQYPNPAFSFHSRGSPPGLGSELTIERRITQGLNLSICSPAKCFSNNSKL